MSATVVQGSVAEGFEPVREEFERNFRERRELGAACCLFHRGEKVVDLWGGFQDEARTRPWGPDTACMVFSTTKGLSAMTIAVAHSRGWFEADAPVADYWPEFGQEGKERVTVRQLLSHQGGICAVGTRLTPSLLADHDAVADVLARQRPWWEPGTRSGYHAHTLGLALGALLRRLDPAGRTVGRFFADEIAAPLGLRFFIGDSADDVAEMCSPGLVGHGAGNAVHTARDAGGVPVAGLADVPDVHQPLAVTGGRPRSPRVSPGGASGLGRDRQRSLDRPGLPRVRGRGSRAGASPGKRSSS